MTARASVFVCTFMLMVAGCASRKDLFVVLPNPDGSAGAVTIDNGAQSVTLDKPYSAGEIRGGGFSPFSPPADKEQPVNITESEVNLTFQGAFAAQPHVPAKFELRFLLDSDEMTAESKQHFNQVFDDIHSRPVYEVEVIGHTDTLGQKVYNQQLSLKRAEAIRDLLVKRGLRYESIATSGRGPLDLAIATADQVAEPLNRRVVIVVR